MIERKIYKLKNRVQHYEWGTRNEEAFIPRLLNEEPTKDKPYAELWIGAHPGASSEIIIGGGVYALDKIIDEYPEEILGKSSILKFGKRLPFLLKVLSAGRALSIQLHPDKKTAESLHSKYPENYPDDNHKPEIAIALDELTALCGFLPAEHIKKYFLKYPELKQYIGDSYYELLMNASPDNMEDSLKKVFTVLMQNALDKKKLENIIDVLTEKISSEPETDDTEKLFLDQQKFYPYDVGLLTFFFFNLLRLRKGQALFIKAGVPHAYIRGNIVECMANSDNVVRAGLTSKFKDVDTILEIMDYTPGEVEIINREQRLHDVLYRTAADEFKLHWFSDYAGLKRKISGEKMIVIVLIIKGTIKVNWMSEQNPVSARFGSGDSFLCPAMLDEFEITAEENSEYYICTPGI